MRVLITGATGFIGRLLVERLAGIGAAVYGLALEDEDARLDIELHPVDLRLPTATAQVVCHVRPDKVIHLAAAGVSNPAIDPFAALQHNVEGTLNLLHACFQNPQLKRPPRQLIVIRTPGEPKPANAYVASKAAAWSYCQMFARRSGWPIVGATVFQAYGPGQPAHTFVQAAARAALAGEDFAMTSGRQARDWIYVSDVVDGLATMLEHELPPGDSVDLGTGHGMTLLNVAQLIYRLAGRGGRPMPGALPDRAGEEIDKIADSTLTSRKIDWAAQVVLEDGLRLVLEALAGH